MSSTYGDQEDDQAYDWTPRIEPGDVPNAVRILLELTRHLQDMLKAWATNRATEEDVSNAYVYIGHQFNDAIAAFAYYEIDLTDIHCFPSDLRVVLEGCLSEEPSLEVYNLFIPRLRGAIWKMLKGLEIKHAEWTFRATQLYREQSLENHHIVPPRTDSLAPPTIG